MPTTRVTAQEIMDRVAALMNDTDKAVYKYPIVLPYLNMAIDDFQEILESYDVSPAEQIASIITLPIGRTKITPPEHPDSPHYPVDLVEPIQLKERTAGVLDAFTLMLRRNSVDYRVPGDMLGDWAWVDDEIQFVSTGALSIREIQLEYVRQPLQQAASESSIVGATSSRSYLSYRAAAMCALFIGENESRATVLNGIADAAIDRLLGIKSKGKQAVATRHRPFRAGFKSKFLG